jgi:histidyl-tRNA synthetase
LTAPLARYVAENFDNLPKPYRSYRHGWVFRNEKPGPGRFRQFMQFDADTVGSASPAADAEMCMMAADAMEALGIPRGSYVVKVNNRKVLDGILEAIGLGGDENAGRRLTVLRAFDKYDRLGVDGVRDLLGSGRLDESGDHTKGAGLNPDQIATVIQLVGTGNMSWAPIYGESDLPTADEQILPKEILLQGLPEDAMAQAPARHYYSSKGLLDRWAHHLKGVAVGEQGVAELEQMLSLVQAAGYGSRRIIIDAGVVRGLEYYTGPVYEVELLLETNDDKGRPVRFGSVGGGGRYDGLVSRFRGEPVPATGFSIGVSRLQAALTLIGKLNTRPAVGPVVVTVFDRDRLADYQKMVAQLRSVDIRAELYLGNPKNMGNQLKYADKRNSPCVIIQGSDEKNDPEGPQIIVKDLKLGAELAALEKDRDEYLQKQADAQRKVPQLDLIDEVRRILARHDIEWN